MDGVHESALAGDTHSRNNVVYLELQDLHGTPKNNEPWTPRGYLIEQSSLVLLTDHGHGSVFVPARWSWEDLSETRPIGSVLVELQARRHLMFMLCLLTTFNMVRATALLSQSTYLIGQTYPLLRTQYF